MSGPRAKSAGVGRKYGAGCGSVERVAPHQEQVAHKRFVFEGQTRCAFCPIHTAAAATVQICPSVTDARIRNADRVDAWPAFNAADNSRASRARGDVRNDV